MRYTRWTNLYLYENVHDNWPKHVAVVNKEYENNVQLNVDVKKEVKLS